MLFKRRFFLSFSYCFLRSRKDELLWWDPGAISEKQYRSQRCYSASCTSTSLCEMDDGVFRSFWIDRQLLVFSWVFKKGWCQHIQRILGMMKKVLFIQFQKWAKKKKWLEWYNDGWWMMMCILHSVQLSKNKYDIIKRRKGRGQEIIMTREEVSRSTWRSERPEIKIQCMIIIQQQNDMKSERASPPHKPEQIKICILDLEQKKKKKRDTLGDASVFDVQRSSDVRRGHSQKEREERNLWGARGTSRVEGSVCGQDDVVEDVLILVVVRLRFDLSSLLHRLFHFHFCFDSFLVLVLVVVVTVIAVRIPGLILLLST